MTSLLTSNSSLQPAKVKAKINQELRQARSPIPMFRRSRTEDANTRAETRASRFVKDRDRNQFNVPNPFQIDDGAPAVEDEALRRLTRQDSDATTLSAASFSALQKSASRQSSRSSSSGRRSTFGLKESTKSMLSCGSRMLSKNDLRNLPS